MNPPLRDARPEWIAVEGNLPPQLQKGGGKEIRDSWRQMKVGFRYGTCEVLRRTVPAEKATGGEEILRWLIGDCGALVEALRRESAWG
jgi:hypothetical protein